MEQKKFIDIEQIREKDIMLEGALVPTITRKNNVSGFHPGDHISITTKIDGSNASFCYDPEIKGLRSFSRNRELKGGEDSLRGFKGWVEETIGLNEACLKLMQDHPEYLIFGEWLGNLTRMVKINYDRAFGFVMYSIWNKHLEQWEDQKVVKDICNQLGLEYIEELYDGPFISWDHCRGFGHSSKYGPIQEGIVIRNLTIMNQDSNKCNHILKIVNQEFQESRVKNKEPKVIDPEVEQAKEKANQLISQVVTENRVSKIISKLQIEGELPQTLNEKMIGEIAKKVPKLVWEDIKKEEPEIVEAAGDFGGKASGQITMSIVRKMLLGE